MKRKLPSIEAALLVLNKGGQGSTAEEMYDLSMQLKRDQAFGYARRMLTLARKDLFVKNQLGLELDQQCALCTYKDADLPLADRLEQALLILKEGRTDLNNTKNQETLGIAGAIFKRKWEADGQKQHLEKALEFYLRGYQQGPENDNGYTGINAAFILDVLAQQQTADESTKPAPSQHASTQLKEADWIRHHIVETLSLSGNKPENAGLHQNWWFLVTIAEALFGLQMYEEASPWLRKAIALKNVPEWQLEVTTRQLARIALLQHPLSADRLQNSEPWRVLKELIADPADELAALETAFSGKLGLALSGGGFRASLYHIGVLAKLAELDMLRRIEVLSCVSGGSIIGAHYYLEVRNLLQTKPDAQITAQDYVDLVNKLSTDFLDGVQRNIRTRVAANYWYNLKMIWLRNYSRTERAGELYEKELFARVQDGEQHGERWLNHLYIEPVDKNGTKSSDFNPKIGNWRRNAKVPVLILNATTLNTGHNWQFTSSWMGESPASVQKIDGNYRLRRMYYKEDGDSRFRRTIRLGHAVAASACVPGMFEPLALDNIFENKVVRLVDGGVHDNQGVIGLLEQDCDVILVSDASGQMGALDDPASNAAGVPLRANDILMERVRNAQFQDLNARYKAGLLKGLMFIHLKMGLDVQSVDWINCEDPSDDDPMYKPQAKLTPFGIRKDIQKQLAAIRTDLDSFNDTEAFALMTSGYLMAGSTFKQDVKVFATPPPVKTSWSFLEIENDLRRPDTPVQLFRLLNIARERLFKAWRLSAPLQAFAVVLAIALVARALISMISWYNQPVVPDGETVVSLGQIFWNGTLVLLCLLILRLSGYWNGLVRFVTGLFMISIGWVAANLHLLIFDQFYLAKGRRRPQKVKMKVEPVQSSVQATETELVAQNSPAES